MNELVRLQEFVEEFGEKCSFTMAQIMQLNVVLEEIVSNVINYAYAGKPKDTTLEVRVDYTPPVLKLEVEDEGKTFDPSKVETPDITLPAEERNIGGLGIHMVKTMMDTIDYEYRNNKNVLILTKKF